MNLETLTQRQTFFRPLVFVILHLANKLSRYYCLLQFVVYLETIVDKIVPDQPAALISTPCVALVVKEEFISTARDVHVTLRERKDVIQMLENYLKIPLSAGSR